MKKKPAAAHAAPKGGEARGSPSNLEKHLAAMPAMSLEEKLIEYQASAGKDIDKFVEDLSQGQQQAIILYYIRYHLMVVWPKAALHYKIIILVSGALEEVRVQ